MLLIHWRFGDGVLIGWCAGEAGGGQAAAESALCCDRSHYRSDVCYLRGDVRTDPSTSSVLLYNAPRGSAPEKVRPYTRKFEGSIMSTIDEVTIVPVVDAGSGSNGTTAGDTGKDSLRRRCDVRHPPGVPAVVFSTGGYTGNVYHEFSDGLIPLFITAQRFAGEVVFVVLEYHYWWLGRYGAVLERLTNYKVVDFRYDRRVHCFSEMIVGLRIHGELVVDPKLMPNGTPSPPPPQIPTLRNSISTFVESLCCCDVHLVLGSLGLSPTTIPISSHDSGY